MPVITLDEIPLGLREFVKADTGPYFEIEAAATIRREKEEQERKLKEELELQKQKEEQKRLEEEENLRKQNEANKALHQIGGTTDTTKRKAATVKPLVSTSADDSTSKENNLNDFTTGTQHTIDFGAYWERHYATLDTLEQLRPVAEKLRKCRQLLATDMERLELTNYKQTVEARIKNWVYNQKKPTTWVAEPEQVRLASSLAAHACFPNLISPGQIGGTGVLAQQNVPVMMLQHHPLEVADPNKHVQAQELLTKWRDESKLTEQEVLPIRGQTPEIIEDMVWREYRFINGEKVLTCG